MKIKKIDWEYGLIGGISMSIPIFIINSMGGVRKALIAAVIQFFYTMFFSLIGNLLCRTLVKRLFILAVIVPALITGILTYLTHFVARSPAPFYSASFSFLIALPFYTMNSLRYLKSDKTLVSLIFSIIKK